MRLLETEAPSSSPPTSSSLSLNTRNTHRCFTFLKLHTLSGSRACVRVCFASSVCEVASVERGSGTVSKRRKHALSSFEALLRLRTRQLSFQAHLVSVLLACIERWRSR